MSSASPPSPPTASFVSGPFVRRLAAEWQLLQQLASVNPGRLRNLTQRDSTFTVTLEHTPGVLPDLYISPLHLLRLEFPLWYPAVPLELYLQQPVLHPNVHPHTGFVCLWDRHRTSNTCEHALHKLTAILCGRLSNPAAVHLMQPSALSPLLSRAVPYAPLQGILHPPETVSAAAPLRRSRLS